MSTPPTITITPPTDTDPTLLALIDSILTPTTAPSSATCPIHMDPFDPSSPPITLPCTHLFCRPCITTWLLTSRLCPLCRRPAYPTYPFPAPAPTHLRPIVWTPAQLSANVTVDVRRMMAARVREGVLVLAQPYARREALEGLERELQRAEGEVTTVRELEAELVMRVRAEYWAARAREEVLGTRRGEAADRDADLDLLEWVVRRMVDVLRGD